MNTPARSIAGLAATAILAASSLVAAPQTVAHWTFGNNGLTDITGNNTITLENHGVTFTNGAALFDGNSYFVTAAPIALGTTTGAFTIECWVRFDANDNYGYIFAPSDASEKGAFIVYQNDGRLWGQLRVVASGAQQQDGAMLSGTGYTSYPHHIAYVVDASKSGTDQAKLYLDGTQLPNTSLNQSGDFSTGFGNRALFIGAHGNGGSPNNGFKGLIDDIRITDGALEPSQFLKFPTICDAMTPANPAFAYYPFGANGPNDATGNGNDLEWKNWQSSSPSYLDGTMLLNGSCSLQSPRDFPFSQFTRSGLTFECFFRTTYTASDAILMETSGNYNSNIGTFIICLQNSSTEVFSALRTDGGRNAEVSTGTPAANDGRWHHVALVYDPAKTGEDLVVSYLDGVKLPTSGSYTDSNLWMIRDNSFFVGARANYQLYATAEFDDVRIMPYALSPSEFQKAPSVNAPVAHWNFGSATPLVDITGNGNDLVNTGVTFADGAAVFTGSGQYLKTASTLDLSAYRHVTIECRYHANSHNKFGVLFGLENTGSKTSGSFVVYKNDNRIFGQFGTTGGWHQDKLINDASSSSYGSAGWHHAAYVLDVTRSDNDECVLYVDGVKQDQTSTLKNTQVLSALLNDKFCIGGGSAYGSNLTTTFDGTMSEIIVTPQVLAPGSFKLSRNPSSAGVIAYWNFGGSTWADKSGNGHTLAATGMSRKNGAAKFDSGATLATSSALDLSTCRSFTVECFAKANSAAADVGLFSFGNGTDAGSFSASIAATGGASSRYVPYAAALNSDATAAGGADGDWHHYALVIDGDATGADQARLYVDGVQAASGALASDAASPALSATFSIGAGFTGLIDDVRITNGALDPSAFMQSADRTETPDAFVLVVR